MGWSLIWEHTTLAGTRITPRQRKEIRFYAEAPRSTHIYREWEGELWCKAASSKRFTARAKLILYTTVRSNGGGSLRLTRGLGKEVGN